ncbi:hypothetical protein DSO57_1015983 [Entomophthora muscae]|uniref:Uncharacterized protein n=1 Tax=Entomophthora muscae TaxID=34485 RepID=A0ACC2U3C3_9FUNG|nr:hypothetical protein DSO57_1015983 [Entomophthora muscae]
MGTKSKTKSRGRPPKTSTKTTRSTTCPPPANVHEGEPARSSSELSGDPNHEPTGPDWHSATQLNLPINQDQTQSNPDSLQNSQPDYRTVRNRPTSSDSSRSNLSASPPEEMMRAEGVPPDVIELWIELQFDFTQVDKWIRAEFNPVGAQHWEAAGFSPACASIWRKAGIDLQWIKMYRQLRMRTGEAKPWTQLSPHTEEVLTAIQNKPPLKDAEVWRRSGRNKGPRHAGSRRDKYFSSFRIPSLAIGWAKSGFSVETAKSWSRACFNPAEATIWNKLGFNPKDARSWSYSEISPDLCCKLREQGWSKEKASLWGPFKDWSVIEAGELMAERFTHQEMKYWLQQGESLEAATAWRKEAAQWVDHKVDPEAAALLQQKVTPSEAAEWLQSGIDVEVLLDWRFAIPGASEAAAFFEEKFKPKEAAAWFELKIQALEAASFRNIGWVPEAVTNWLRSNKVTFGEIRKYFHPNIGPKSATIWKQHGFAPGEAKLWADLIVDVKVAITLRSHRVLPLTIAKFIERKYTLDEAIMYALEGTPLEKARPPQNRDHSKASYSERVKRSGHHTIAHHKAKWVTFTNLPTDKSSECVRESIITGAVYYVTVLKCREEGNFKARCMRLTKLHVLPKAAPIVRSRNTALPRFVRLPGCSGSVIYVEPENTCQVCHFCYSLGHNILQSHIKKGVHIRDYEMDIEKGVTG